ncbi:MAG: glycosyltransferase [Thermodesulfovibrionales bacterium]|nr:glycosyltransferase [Thermodesulfovibrionales bacterium]
MNKSISVIIPNYNGSSTIGRCLEAAFSSEYDNFEVIVADDCSTDNSAEIIKKFPCKLIPLDEHSGASKARNTGAKNSSGEILFFIDADCLIQRDTLTKVNKALLASEDAIIGGTYSAIPYDKDFFSIFQSIFINYSEMKKEPPDYIPTHAMVIARDIFMKSGGFQENFLPILEDVEFSHRLRKTGYKLMMNPEILVRHIFNFTLRKSLKNAYRKSKYWTIYSIMNKDIFKDSGAASLELKFNVVSFFTSALLLCLFLLMDSYFAFIFSVIIQVINIRIINRKLFRAFLDAKGLPFTFFSGIHYIAVYPIAVGVGSIAGIADYLSKYERI